MAHGHEINSFQAPPPVGHKEGFQFLVYGDMGDPDHHRAKAPGCALASGTNGGSRAYPQEEGSSCAGPRSASGLG